MPPTLEPLHAPGRTRLSLRFLRNVLRASLATAALLLSPVEAAHAHTFDDVVFFGDSLTDTGNVCATVAQLRDGYATGRCSNGPIWADYLVEGLGLGAEATSSASGGSNYAIGGSTTGALAGQVGLYLAAGAGTADPGALHVLWFGGNDVLFELLGLGSGEPGAMQAAAGRIGAGIQTLAAAGARHFAVVNVPDVGGAYGNPLENPPFGSGATPFSEADRVTLRALAIEFNTALDGVLATLHVESLIAVDALAAFDAVIADPSAFGFPASAVDATSQAQPFATACLANPTCVADPQGAVADGFIIFDSIHPTTAFHREIANEALAVVVPEPSGSACIAIGLAWLGLRRRPPVRA